MEDEGRPPEHRDEIRLFAYHMTGSLALADALSQDLLLTDCLPPGEEGAAGREALLRAASRLCLDSPGCRPARGLPAGESSSREEKKVEGGQKEWLEPFPDALVPLEAIEHSRYGARESVSLEFVVALQALEPASRAELLLNDVYVLGEGTAGSVVGDRNGRRLEKARRTLEDARGRLAGYAPPPEEIATGLMMRYIFCWETADPRKLDAMMSEGVVFRSTSPVLWLQGRNAVLKWAEKGPLADGENGNWRLLPTRANGQLAFGVYRRDLAGRMYIAQSLQVVYFDGETVSEIIDFGWPSLFSLFGLPGEVFVQGCWGG